MFAITTAPDFFLKFKDDFLAFDADIANSGLAMNSILSSYHIHEWVWARWLKTAAPKKIGDTMIRDKSSFVAWLESSCPHFAILQELANGSKHCSPVHSTDEVKGYGRGPYGIGPWGAPYLLIDLGDDKSGAARWLVASDMLQDVFKFWTEFFEEQGLATSRSGIAEGAPTKLDHCVIHVSDWERSNTFYVEVMGAALVPRPVGYAYRFGDKQLNVHGPGVKPAEVARLPVQPGNSDLCFEWDGPIEDAMAHLKAHGVAVERGPLQRFGAKGPGTSVYFRDPDGSLMEFMSYAT